MDETLQCEFHFGPPVWCYRRSDGTWGGKYCAVRRDDAWVIVSRNDSNTDVRIRVPVAGPFNTEEEAKAVLVAMHRMNK